MCLGAGVGVCVGVAATAAAAAAAAAAADPSAAGQCRHDAFAFGADRFSGLGYIRCRGMAYVQRHDVVPWARKLQRGCERPVRCRRAVHRGHKRHAGTAAATAIAVFAARWDGKLWGGHDDVGCAARCEQAEGGAANHCRAALLAAVHTLVGCV